VHRLGLGLSAGFTHHDPPVHSLEEIQDTADDDSDDENTELEIEFIIKISELMLRLDKSVLPRYKRVLKRVEKLDKLDRDLPPVGQEEEGLVGDLVILQRSVIDQKVQESAGVAKIMKAHEFVVKVFMGKVDVRIQRSLFPCQTDFVSFLALPCVVNRGGWLGRSSQTSVNLYSSRVYKVPVSIGDLSLFFSSSRACNRNPFTCEM
jgi:hypothetical protein